MLTDFTPYRFSDKTIRVNYNEIENKHWFVIEDVLCTIFANGKKYWAELKQEMIAAGMTSPTAFVTCECKEGKIDVANYKQMLHILSFVPNRKAKKARIAFWLQNHIEKDKKAENVTVVHYKEPKKESTKEKILNMLNSENSAIPAITGIILIHVPIVAYALMNKGIINSVVMLLIWVVSILG
ncbi:MAG: hypothetical protein IKO56_09540, partial [Alphaproteobacteria bacterium]|nr:hypothetical protein [Alphaproteobacteria bacterium]